MNVKDDNEGSDDEENLHGTTWEDWALILIGLALVIFFTVVAGVGLFSFFIRAEEVIIPLRWSVRSRLAHQEITFLQPVGETSCAIVESTSLKGRI